SLRDDNCAERRMSVGRRLAYLAIALARYGSSRRDPLAFVTPLEFRCKARAGRVQCMFGSIGSGRSIESDGPLPGKPPRKSASHAVDRRRRSPCRFVGLWLELGDREMATDCRGLRVSTRDSQHRPRTNPEGLQRPVREMAGSIAKIERRNDR